MTGDTSMIATARLAAGALFIDEVGRVLLVKPGYKPGWDIPGGYVAPGESPLSACRRELMEELGMSWPVRPYPFVVDWAPRLGEGDKVLFIFDGGQRSVDDLKDLSFADGEITEARFVALESLDQHMQARLAKRIRLAARAQVDGNSVYAEHGAEVP
jgi:ADP-ribose pyrophosphatase YjhB (NUDIX family)